MNDSKHFPPHNSKMARLLPCPETVEATSSTIRLVLSTLAIKLIQTGKLDLASRVYLNKKEPTFQVASFKKKNNNNVNPLQHKLKRKQMEGEDCRGENIYLST